MSDEEVSNDKTYYDGYRACFIDLIDFSFGWLKVMGIVTSIILLCNLLYQGIDLESMFGTFLNGFSSGLYPFLFLCCYIMFLSLRDEETFNLIIKLKGRELK